MTTGHQERRTRCVLTPRLTQPTGETQRPLVEDTQRRDIEPRSAPRGAVSVAAGGLQTTAAASHPSPASRQRPLIAQQRCPSETAAGRALRAHDDALALHAGLGLFAEAIARLLHSPLKRVLFEEFTADELRAGLEWRALLRHYPASGTHKLDLANARRQAIHVGRGMVCLWCDVRIGADAAHTCLPSTWDVAGLSRTVRRWDPETAGAGIMVVDELITAVRQ
ncbi:MAG: hypothetical protein AAGF32_00865 [Pseudomonadota bacterium]